VSPDDAALLTRAQFDAEYARRLDGMLALLTRHLDPTVGAVLDVEGLRNQQVAMAGVIASRLCRFAPDIEGASA
jgi:hypothetical protein